MSDINTGADMLAQLVKGEGRVSIPEAAKRLNVSPELIEQWAHLMEESELLSIEFGLRKTFLVPFKEKKGSDKGGAAGAIKAKIENTHWHFTQDKHAWDLFRATLEKERERFEKLAGPTLKQLKQLKRYERIGEDIRDADKRIEELTPKVEKKFAKSRKDLDALDTDAKAVVTRLTTARKKLSTLKRELNKTQKQLEDASEELGAQRALMYKLHKESSQLGKEVAEAEKHASRLPKRSIKEARKDVLEASAKTHDSFKERAKALEHHEKELAKREKRIGKLQERLSKAARNKRSELVAFGTLVAGAQGDAAKTTTLAALVTATEDLLAAGEKDAARAVYTRVRTLFSKAHEDERSAVYDRCVAIHKQL